MLCYAITPGARGERGVRPPLRGGRLISMDTTSIIINTRITIINISITIINLLIIINIIMTSCRVLRGGQLHHGPLRGGAVGLNNIM